MNPDMPLTAVLAHLGWTRADSLGRFGRTITITSSSGEARAFSADTAATQTWAWLRDLGAISW